jgi:hypothetical protein
MRSLWKWQGFFVYVFSRKDMLKRASVFIFTIASGKEATGWFTAVGESAIRICAFVFESTWNCGSHIYL